MEAQHALDYLLVISVQHLTSPTITVGTEWTFGTLRILGIVDALLVRTANDAVSQDDALCVVSSDEREDLFVNIEVTPQITFAEPALKKSGA